MYYEPDKTDGIVPKEPENPDNLYNKNTHNWDFTFNNFSFGWYCPECEWANETKLEGSERINQEIKCEGHKCGAIYRFKADVSYSPYIKNIVITKNKKAPEN